MKMLAAPLCVALALLSTVWPRNIPVDPAAVLCFFGAFPLYSFCVSANSCR
jgi:hypothetical protein